MDNTPHLSPSPLLPKGPAKKGTIKLNAPNPPPPHTPAQVTSLAARLRSRIPKGSNPVACLLDWSFASAKNFGEGGLFGFTAPGLSPSGCGEILILLLNALRNSSFVPSNERAIGHSARVLQVCRRAFHACGGWGLDHFW